MIRAFIEMFFSLTNLIFLSIILGWFFLWRKKTKTIGRILILSAIVCLYLFSITPISDLMIKPLESKYPLCHFNDSQIIQENDNNVVILSGGLRNKNLPLISSLAESTFLRVMKAIEIYKHKPQVNLIISGEKSSTEKIKLFLVDFGIPLKNIIIDGNSHNTYQNAQDIEKIVGDRKFILVTSAFHMPRAMFIFKKLGMNPYPCPTDFREERDYNLLDFFPQSKNLKKSNLAFHEYLSKLFYKVYVR